MHLYSFHSLKCKYKRSGSTLLLILPWGFPLSLFVLDYQLLRKVTWWTLCLMVSGQSQPPCHLSVFLEVTDSRNTSSDWSCFVSHRLSVVNQRMEDKSVTKESQNRYSKAAKDWGWREFVTLTSLFDQDSGFLVQDTVVFSAEVLILKETSTMLDLTDQDSESSNSGSQIDKIGKRSSFTWRVENFMSFKEIMETRKIFSKFFQAGGCELRIGELLFLLILTFFVEIVVTIIYLSFIHW